MRGALILLLLSSRLWCGERWQMQYFFDRDREELHLGAIAFCSETRGVAAGFVSSNGAIKPVSLVTSNGGASWAQVPAQEAGHALFVFDETSAWMLTESGIWFSDECGRTWRRVHKQRFLTDLRFVSQNRGWATGGNKTVIETSDGGKTWTPVKAAKDLDATAEWTTFSAIEFATPKIGILFGRSVRPRRERMPLWLDPEPERRRELPALTVSLETRDAGATWSTAKVSMFGRISRVLITPSGAGLVLVEFDDYFDYPSEILSLNRKTDPKESRLFRRKDAAVTDLAIADTAVYLAGFQPAGAVFRSPIPGKVRIFRSSDLKQWTESEVDYRAVATRVYLARGGNALWAATDTGMILKRVLEP